MQKEEKKLERKRGKVDQFSEKFGNIRKAERMRNLREYEGELEENSRNKNVKLKFTEISCRKR